MKNGRHVCASAKCTEVNESNLLVSGPGSPKQIVSECMPHSRCQRKRKGEMALRDIRTMGGN